MHGGAPGGWVVGCKLLGTGSGGIVGFWFAPIIVAVSVWLER